jgi:hypothetical protein
VKKGIGIALRVAIALLGASGFHARARGEAICPGIDGFNENYNTTCYGSYGNCVLTHRELRPVGYDYATCAYEEYSCYQALSSGAGESCAPAGWNPSGPNALLDRFQNANSKRYVICESSGDLSWRDYFPQGLKGNWDKMPIRNDYYRVMVNFWNMRGLSDSQKKPWGNYPGMVDGSLCIEWDDDTGEYRIALHPGDVPDVPEGYEDDPTARPPTSYPAQYSGCHWGNCTKDAWGPRQEFVPIYFGAFLEPDEFEYFYGKDVDQGERLASYPAYWNFEITNPGSAIYDVAFDVWFNSTPDSDGQNDGLEVMIWGDRSGYEQAIEHSGMKPVGGKRNADGPVAVWGLEGEYDVWSGRLFGSEGKEWNVVSFVRTDLDLDRPWDATSHTIDADLKQLARWLWYYDPRCPMYSDDMQAYLGLSGNDNPPDYDYCLQPWFYLTSVQVGTEVWKWGNSDPVNGYQFYSRDFHAVPVYYDWGECEEDTLYYRGGDGSVYSYDCRADGQTCTWVDSEGWYNCH